MEKFPSTFENQNSNSESLPENEQEHTSQNDKDEPKFSRRDFLKTLGKGSIVATAEIMGISSKVEAKNKKKPHQESEVDTIKRELFETREILPCRGNEFEKRVETWYKRYAGKDPEYDHLVLLYKKRKGFPLKTIHQELENGWQDLVLDSDLKTVYNITKKEDAPFDLLFLALSESHWKKKATSRVGAVGPWQFMPATAKEWGLKVTKSVDERSDVPKSTVAACNFLKNLYKRTFILEERRNKKGKKIEQLIPISKNDRWIWAFWAYNRGPKHVFKDLRRTRGNPNEYFKVCRNKESREYAPKVFGLAKALIEMKYGKKEKESPQAVEVKNSQADKMYEEYPSKNFSSNKEKIQFLEKIINTYEKEARDGTHSSDYVEDAIDVVYEEIREVKKNLPKDDSGAREEELEVVESDKEDRQNIKKPSKEKASEVEEEDELPTVMYKIKAGDNATKIATWLAPSPQKIARVENIIRGLNPKVRNWNSLRLGQNIIVPGTMIEVPLEKLSAILCRYYPSLNTDISEKYLKWLNDMDPSRGKIKPGEMILVPVDLKDLE